MLQVQVTSVDRWESTQRKTVQVDCSTVVSSYNKSLGGVEQLDTLIAFFRIHIMSTSFSLKIFFHFVDMVDVVSWVLYRRDCASLCVPVKQRMDLLKLKFYSSTFLLQQGKYITMKKRGRPSSSSVEAKFECKKKRVNETRAGR
ncbi:hypothetical protein HPB48_005541 [Haemaphysalis longicornis]|uniref:Uncharacterized protein n=1 Tax=Haemaphysalis longicornis TaxID=44386 RepID=A0A9J6GND8_HAELO|nr:hypothetical protein HPB48_005541 [Haemaphysalis longicornis]